MAGTPNGWAETYEPRGEVAADADDGPRADC